MTMTPRSQRAAYLALQSPPSSSRAPFSLGRRFDPLSGTPKTVSDPLETESLDSLASSLSTYLAIGAIVIVVLVMFGAGGWYVRRLRRRRRFGIEDKEKGWFRVGVGAGRRRRKSDATKQSSVCDEEEKGSVAGVVVSEIQREGGKPRTTSTEGKVAEKESDRTSAEGVKNPFSPSETSLGVNENGSEVEGIPTTSQDHNADQRDSESQVDPPRRTGP